MVWDEHQFLATILRGSFFILMSYVIISFVEHITHRYLMHMNKFHSIFCKLSPYLYDVFHAHAILHHGKWYKQFDHEPDPVGKEVNLAIRLLDTAVVLIFTVPIWGLVMWISPLGGCILVVMAFFHHRLWSILHRQMHIPKDIFFKNWAVYKYLARHHFMHHQMVGKNFNVVFPLADVFMGRVAKPRLRDVREMLYLGHLAPKTKRASQRVKKCAQERNRPVHIVH